MYRFICSRRYVNLLFAIGIKKRKNILQLSRESDMTSSHLTIVMRQFEKEGLINKIKNGREYEIEFTEKGKSLLKIIQEYNQLALADKDNYVIEISKEKFKKEVTNGKKSKEPKKSSN